jgi:F-type H+-transporting ATPase subunit delta
MAEASPNNISFDSAREQLGKTYARGLLGAAEGQHLTDRVLEELDSVIDDVLNKLPDFEQLLVSPRVSVDEKHRILEAAFSARMSELMLNFLKVASRHGRMDCLRQIRSAARKLYNDMRGRVEVNVETAGAINSQVRSQIQQRLTVALGRQVELWCNVNPQLLGGLVVRIGDTVYDGSLENQLVRMRSDALDRTAQVIRDSLQRFLVSQ